MSSAGTSAGVRFGPAQAVLIGYILRERYFEMSTAHPSYDVGAG
jgi:hypothetical protein